MPVDTRRQNERLGGVSRSQRSAPAVRKMRVRSLAIPAHLLTLEAFQLYAAHLKADGVVAVNLTNRYIDLLPVAKAAAKALGWHFAAHVSQGQGMIVSSTWVFLSPKPVDFDAGEHGVFVDPLRIPEIAAWTDDFHGIWPLLRLGW